MRYMFGVDQKSALQDLLLHIGIMAAVIYGCAEILTALQRERRNGAVTRRSKNRSLHGHTYYELRLLKTATIPLLICSTLYIVTAKLEQNLTVILICFVLNATIMLLAEHTSHGNRDARSMTGLDGIVMGILGAVSVLPGVSRTGIIASYTTARGVETDRVVNWAVLLGIPALALGICFDVVGLFTVGAGVISLFTVFGCILSGLAAFCGGFLGIRLLRLILSHSGFSGFAYYSIGAALFTFVLYLIT